MCVYLHMRREAHGLTLPPCRLWGLVIAAIGNLAMAASLSEIVHVFPTSGGALWILCCILSFAKTDTLLSRTLSLCAHPQPSRMGSPHLVVCRLVRLGRLDRPDGYDRLACRRAPNRHVGACAPGLRGAAVPDFRHFHRFHRTPSPFLVLLSVISAILTARVQQVIATLINIYASRLLPYVNSSAIIWSLTGAATIIVVTLACASPDYQSGNYVFRTYTNTTGWNSALTFPFRRLPVPKPSC